MSAATEPRNGFLRWRRVEAGSYLTYGESPYYVLRCERDNGPRGGKRWMWSFGRVVKSPKGFPWPTDRECESDWSTAREAFVAAEEFHKNRRDS